MMRRIIRWFFRDILDELQAIRKEIVLASREVAIDRKMEPPAMGMPMRKYEPLQPLGPLTGR